MAAFDRIYIQESTKWFRTEKTFDNDVEYVRTDAFIEKACSILNRMILEVVYEGLEGNLTQHYDKNEFIEVFRNYMKGE